MMITQSDVRKLICRKGLREAKGVVGRYRKGRVEWREMGRKVHQNTRQPPSRQRQFR